LAGHVGRISEFRNAYNMLGRKPEGKGRDNFKDLRIDGRIILKWILDK